MLTKATFICLNYVKNVVLWNIMRIVKNYFKFSVEI